MRTLQVPTTFEQSRQELEGKETSYGSSMAQFVQPVTKAERILVDVFSRMKPGSGRALILKGNTGSGKSTFVQSLSWRKHIGIARLLNVDCSRLSVREPLLALSEEIQNFSFEYGAKDGLTVLCIDYLESLYGTSEREKRSFFQTVNGILRRSNIFLIWPMVDRVDAEETVNEARKVSNTIFDEETPILDFEGPDSEQFVSIFKNTVSVFNNGADIQEFLLTDAELEEKRDEILEDSDLDTTIRNYIEKIVSHWSKKSGYLESVLSRVPKPNEIWFLFCYPEAEDSVSVFAAKGDNAISAWSAYHAKLWEYVPDTQRAGRWPQATRLQYAVAGAFTTRILHLTPQSLVSLACSYAESSKLEPVIAECPEKWKSKKAARRLFSKTSVFRQLSGESPSKGKTKGGPASLARTEAFPAFSEINKLASGSGNDRHINYAVAKGMRESLPDDYGVHSEIKHPWLPHITPDIRVDLPSGIQVCIEICYTKNEARSQIPDYVLDKLANYMDALEQHAGVTFSQYER